MAPLSAVGNRPLQRPQAPAAHYHTITIVARLADPTALTALAITANNATYATSADDGSVSQGR